MAEFRIVKRTRDSEVWEKSQDDRVSYIKIVFDHDLDAVVAYTSDHKGPWVGDGTRYDSFQEAQEAWGISDGDVLAAPLPAPDRLAPILADLTTRDREVLADVLAELQRARAKWGPQPHPWGLSWYRFDHLRQCAGDLEAEARRTLIGHDPTWAAIIGEEAGEALRESDPARAVAELIQVGAMVLAAMAECPDLQGVERG